MKVEFDDEGVLIVSAESHTEKMALQYWTNNVTSSVECTLGTHLIVRTKAYQDSAYVFGDIGHS